jgi:hypothetical protein
MTVDEALRERSLRDSLAHQYRSAIAHAEEGFTSHAADEDAVTGALGEAMRASGVATLSDGSVVSWTTTYKKLRGRGPRAPEKRLGADGVFEIEFEDAAGTRSRKSLGFQAKQNGTIRVDQRFRAQAERISQLPGGGLIVIYSANGYFAGDAALIAREERPLYQQSLADALAGDFLACKRGSSRYYYDAVREVMVVSAPEGGLDIRKIPIHSRIRTSARSTAKEGRIQ